MTTIADRLRAAQETEYQNIRRRVMQGAVEWRREMEYTHRQNIDFWALPVKTYFSRIAPYPFPSGAAALARRLKVMLYTGFVLDREFDTCFEQGNGREVIAHLVREAETNPRLKAAIIECERYIGTWDQLQETANPPFETGSLFGDVEADPGAASHKAILTEGATTEGEAHA